MLLNEFEYAPSVVCRVCGCLAAIDCERDSAIFLALHGGHAPYPLFASENERVIFAFTNPVMDAIRTLPAPTIGEIAAYVRYSASSVRAHVARLSDHVVADDGRPRRYSPR